MPDAAKNFAKGTLSQGYDDIATSIVLVTGDGARFPAVPFNATWWNSTDFPDASDDPNREIVRVTAISTDTLTITRAQENTAALTHELEGKVYKLLAGLTAKVINSEMLPVARTGNDYSVDVPGVLSVQSESSVSAKSITGSARLESLAGGVVAHLGNDGECGLGDVDENDSGAALLVSNSLAQVSMRGHIGTDQIASASGPVGTVIGKAPYYNLAGTLVGYVPIYDSIT
jgi:hypothetical protein